MHIQIALHVLPLDRVPQVLLNLTYLLDKNYRLIATKKYNGSEDNTLQLVRPLPQE